MSQPLFTRHYLSPKYHVKIIKSFSKQSIWSSKAQSLNATLGTQLGTLVHLPFEVRQQIYKHVFDNYYPSVPKTFDYLGCARPELDDPLIKDHPVGGVFELDSYNIISEQGFVVNLAHASPTLKDEFEHFFLFSNDFKFQCPKKLSEFLGQLSNSHRAQLLRITIELLSTCTCCSGPEGYQGWQLICPLLPESLRRMTINLGQDQLRRFEWVDGMAGPAQPENIHAATHLVTELSNGVRRRCRPGVVVAMHEDIRSGLNPHDLHELNQAMARDQGG